MNRETFRMARFLIMGIVFGPIPVIAMLLFLNYLTQ